MGRVWHAFGFGILLTLALGFLSAAKPFPGYLGQPAPPQVTLKQMKDGTADHPYVRRRLVPFLVRTAQSAVSPSMRANINETLSNIRPLRPFLIERAAVVDRADALDGVICLVIWLVAFTVFAWSLESETVHYLNEPAFHPPYPPILPVLLTVDVCLIVVLFLHVNFAYDPVTLAC